MEYGQIIDEIYSELLLGSSKEEIHDKLKKSDNKISEIEFENLFRETEKHFLENKYTWKQLRVTFYGGLIHLAFGLLLIGISIFAVKLIGEPSSENGVKFFFLMFFVGSMGLYSELV